MRENDERGRERVEKKLHSSIPPSSTPPPLPRSRARLLQAHHHPTPPPSHFPPPSPVSLLPNLTRCAPSSQSTPSQAPPRANYSSTERLQLHPLSTPVDELRETFELLDAHLVVSRAVEFEFGKEGGVVGEYRCEALSQAVKAGRSKEGEGAGGGRGGDAGLATKCGSRRRGWLDL